MIAFVLYLPYHRHHLRRTALLTLLAWVLASLAGLVNACQLQPQGLRAHAAVGATHPGLAASSVAAAEEGARLEHVDRVFGGEHAAGTVDAGKAGCLKFCDDESSTVAKGKTAQPDVPAPVLVARADWQAALHGAVASTRRATDRPYSKGPPLVIRFLRLTI